MRVQSGRLPSKVVQLGTGMGDEAVGTDVASQVVGDQENDIGAFRWHGDLDLWNRNDSRLMKQDKGAVGERHSGKQTPDRNTVLDRLARTGVPVFVKKRPRKRSSAVPTGAFDPCKKCFTPLVARHNGVFAVSAAHGVNRRLREVF